MLTNLIPRVEQLAEKKLVGKSLSMTFATNQTQNLWQRFMPHRNEIEQTISDDLFAVQIYPIDFFDPFNPNTPFIKWAAKEVSDFSFVPAAMETFLLPGGLYAVFNYVGNENNAAEIFRYMIGVWLPQSTYTLDNRPHFEVLGPKYKHGDPESEEQIWIPIKLKE